MQPRRNVLGMRDFTATDIRQICNLARRHQLDGYHNTLDTFRGGLVMLEPSTRTVHSMTIAMEALGMPHPLVVGLLESSVAKDESLLDTVLTLSALGCDVIGVRSPEPFAALNLTIGLTPFDAPNIINLGDGSNAHPTQALLDVYTAQETFGERNNFIGMTVAIVGDFPYSRVAHSDAYAFALMGAKVITAGWPGSVPPLDEGKRCGVTETYYCVMDAVRNADIIIPLRIQKERRTRGSAPSKLDYLEQYGITEDILKGCKPGVKIMAPGPINVGVEISREVAYGPNSLILQQVAYGPEVRAATIYALVKEMMTTPQPIPANEVSFLG